MGKKIVYSLKSLNFSIHRYVFYSEEFVSFIEFNGFASSSNQVYATVIYVRLITNKEIKVKFLPAKQLTIPQLELLTCLLFSKHIKTVYKSIKHKITIA